MLRKNNWKKFNKTPPPFAIPSPSAAGKRDGLGSWEQESWSSSPAVALRRVGLVRHLSSTVELILIARVAGKPEPRVWGLAPRVSAAALDKWTRAVLEIPPWLCGCGRASGLTNVAATKNRKPGLWVGQPQCLLYLIRSPEVCERASLADPRLQGFHDTKQCGTHSDALRLPQDIFFFLFGKRWQKQRAEVKRWGDE